MSKLKALEFAFGLCVSAGCTSSSGNLYFLSAQRIGLDVAASDPASNAAPKVLIGYESVKGAVNPVKNADGTLRDQAYSVLGITGVTATGSAHAGLAVAEWFATGLAAEILARNELTPLALAGAPSLTPEVLARATREQQASTFYAISGTERFLSSLAAPSAKQDAVLRDLGSLNEVASALQFSTFSNAGARTNYTPSTASGWQRVTAARQDILNSIEFARRRSADTSVGTADRQCAADAKAALEGILQKFDQDILASSAAKAAWQELVGIIRAGK